MSLKLLKPEPLNAEAFAPYGDLIRAPESGEPLDFTSALSSSRPEAELRLTSVAFSPIAVEDLSIKFLERHPFSSQSFFPLAVSRYLVAVAPKLADSERPDLDRLKLFLAGPGQGVTYRADVWHHGMCVLDRPASFLILMWQDGTSGDQEILHLDQPIPVTL